MRHIHIPGKSDDEMQISLQDLPCSYHNLEYDPSGLILILLPPSNNMGQECLTTLQVCHPLL